MIRKNLIYMVIVLNVSGTLHAMSNGTKLSYIKKLKIHCSKLNTIKLPLTENDIAEVARERLKQYVEETGEYELFKIMQEIFKIAREVREEFEPLDFSIGDGQKLWPGSNPFYCQTKQGFFISTDMTPDKLYTPWGYVELFGGGCGKGWAFDVFNQAFLKRFKTSFAYVTKSSLDRDRVKFYALKQQEGSQEVIDLKALLVSGNYESYENIYRELSEEEIKAQQGKEIIIRSNYCGCESVYKLHEVNGHQLPEPEMLPWKKYRSYKVTNMIWDILQDRYNQEYSITKKAEKTSASRE